MIVEETQIEPKEIDNLTPEEIAAREAELAKETPSEGDEKLYAGKYKTVEELEAGYGNSNKEATRMAQEINRLTTQLRQAHTPAQKEVVKDKIINLSEHFDEGTAKVLDGYFSNLVEKKFANFNQSNQAQTEFEGQVNETWEETKKLYPDVANPQSKLYIRANEIMFERRLADLDADGTVRLLTPFAYRLAVDAAAAESGRQAAEAKPNQIKKNQAGIVQGRGSKSVSQGKLTFEEYSKMSDEDQDAYDAQNRR